MVMGLDGYLAGSSAPPEEEGNVRSMKAIKINHPE
jgi:hypothetical protein